MIGPCLHILPCPTEHALEYIEAIRLFVGLAPADAKLEQLSAIEWNVIMHVEKWLDSFREATTLMLVAQAPALSVVLTIFCDIQDDIQAAYRELPLLAPLALKQGVLNAHWKLSNYYYLTDASPYYIWASRKSYVPVNFSVISSVTLHGSSRPPDLNAGSIV